VQCTTRENGFWSTRLPSVIEALGPSLTGVRVYLFGSATRTELPRDLDILFVYDSGVIDGAALTALSRRFVTHIQATTGLAVDLCRLSDAEAESSQFPLEEGAVLLRGPS
jgi:predicted nucleotidyltransferase